MIKLLLAKVIFLIALAPLIAQTAVCVPAKDSVWSAKGDFKLPFVKPNKKRTTFIFEDTFKDTISIIIDGRLIVKQYMETDGLVGRVIPEVVIARPSIGSVKIKTNSHRCTEFTLKKGYAYAYISRGLYNKWFVVYSNHQRMYF